MQITIAEINELEKVAEQLLNYAPGHLFWVLKGEMGAGKTTTIKAICAYLGVADKVSSPTFSLVNEYQGRDKKIYHFDFYRIKNESEAYDIGYEDYFYSDAYCLVEWAEKIPNLLPSPYIEVNISLNSDNTRTFTLSVQHS